MCDGPVPDRRGVLVDEGSLLIGQPTLRCRIKLGTFAALDQRIALRYTLTAMSDTETSSYIAHHLALAGRSDPLFSDDATALIHQLGRGTPRAVNNLAVQALVAAYAAGKAIVDESSPPEPPSPKAPPNDDTLTSTATP